MRIISLFLMTMAARAIASPLRPANLVEKRQFDCAELQALWQQYLQDEWVDYDAGNYAAVSNDYQWFEYYYEAWEDVGCN